MTTLVIAVVMEKIMIIEVRMKMMMVEILGMRRTRGQLRRRRGWGRAMLSMMMMAIMTTMMI